jgi:RHS repeat-associated protein
VTRYRWTAAGKRAAVVDPLGHETTYGYDSAGRLITVTDAEGGVAHYGYDSDGRKTSATSPAGLVTKFGYDSAGRNTSVTDPRGGVTKYTYDENGRQTSVTTPAGEDTHNRYDAAGRLVAVTDPAGQITSYGYDGVGNFTTVTDPRGSVTKYGYDGNGRMISETDPLGRVSKRTFDGSGNVTALTGADGKTIRTSYDAVGQTTKRTGGDASIDFGYDGDGRRTSMKDATGTTSYTYDPAGRLLTVAEPDGQTFTSSYDLAGRRTTLRYSDGRSVAFSYDKVGRLTGVDDPKLGKATYQLNADGQLLNESLPHAGRRQYDYDSGLLARYRQSGLDLPLQDVSLDRDADGRITKQLAPHDVLLHKYAYDQTGRLVSATGGVDGNTDFSYDANGNATRISRDKLVTTLKYDDADELTSTASSLAGLPVSSTAYTYDAAGRLTSTATGHQTTALSYDAFGQQSGATEDDGATSVKQSLVRNGDGLLTSVTTANYLGSVKLGSLEENYAWTVGDSTPQILTQRSDDVLGKLADADFVYGYGRTFAGTKLGGAEFARDVNGSAQTTLGTQAWVQAGAYDVLGQAQPGTPAITNPQFGFHGELALGDTIDLRARDYDPTTGRFTTRDPLDLLPGKVQIDNPYSYANDDPVNLADPLGQFPIAIGGGAGLLGSVIGGLGGNLASVLAKILAVVNCPNAGNSLEGHPKCFQGVLYRTRGGITNAAALDKDENALNAYWQSGQRERAAQAVTIHQLNWNRESIWDSFKDKFGAATAISENVDWEVGPGWNVWRIDIVTDEQDIFEVKEWRDGAQAEVAAQLRNYVSWAAMDGITFAPSIELHNWVDTFSVDTSLWSWLMGNDQVYVWGLGNDAGHIYFAQGDDAPARVRAQKAQEQQNTCIICIPIPIPVPVPVPVVA